MRMEITLKQTIEVVADIHYKFYLLLSWGDKVVRLSCMIHEGFDDGREFSVLGTLFGNLTETEQSRIEDFCIDVLNEYQEKESEFA